MAVGPAEAREPVTTREHDQPWTADLETERHAVDSGLVVAEAIDAVQQTRPGIPIDLVTHERHGEPDSYLVDPLRSAVPDVAVTDRSRCTCGGYVISVVRSPRTSE